MSEEVPPIDKQPRNLRSNAVFMVATYSVQPLLALLFLSLIPCSGPSTAKYWWLGIEMKDDGGNIWLGALGWCYSDKATCQGSSYGYHISEPESASIVPVVLIYHLIVLIFHSVLTVVNLIAFFKLSGLIFDSPRLAQLLILGTAPLSLLFQVIGLALDSVVLSKIKGDSAVASVTAQGSFWLTIPAFIFSTLWFVASIMCYRGALRFREFASQRIDKAFVELQNEEKSQNEEIKAAQTEWGVLPLAGKSAGSRGMWGARRGTDDSEE